MSSDIPQGYLPPDHAYSQAMEFTLENDPLVNDSTTAGIGGWFNKITGVFTRSGKTLLPLFAVTFFVPAVVVGIVGGVGGSALVELLNSQDASVAAAAPPYELFAGAAVIAVFLSLIASVLQFAGYAGATYIATKEAAGLTVRWTEGLAYGFRRCMGLFGWYMLTGLAIGIPAALIAFCLFNVASVFAVLVIIPLAFYAVMAASMVGPAYLFERRNALGRSFGLFHGAPGRMSGRLALIGLVYMLISGAAEAAGVVSAAVPVTVPQLPIQAVAAVIVAGVQAAGLMVIFAGILVTYAERRGDEGSLTPHLVNDL